MRVDLFLKNRCAVDCIGAMFFDVDPVVFDKVVHLSNLEICHVVYTAALKRTGNI